MKICRYLAFSALLAINVSSANAQDYDKGFDAYLANDFKTAFKEWMPLAESGDASAQANIGTLYTKGAGVIQSDIEAVKWYRLAADQGDALGQGKLGLMYALGKGVIQSDIEAVKWYRLAAGQGNAEVQALLGVAHEEGRGVIQNDVMAHMWLNIASANGSEGAAGLRDAIAAEMTREALEKAQAMAQECMNSGYENCGE